MIRAVVRTGERSFLARTIDAVIAPASTFEPGGGYAWASGGVVTPRLRVVR